MTKLQLLHSLRWQEDRLIYSEEYGDYRWLKPCYDEYGKRIGITTCCQYDYECDRHKEIRVKSEKQNKILN